MKAHPIALILVALFALASLSGCALDSIAARQDGMTGLWEELAGPLTFGQSFVSASDNLYRIDLSTATYARTNSAPVIFHLRSSPTAGSDIYSASVPGPEIQNDRPTSFLFPPLPDSRGRSYYFFIESPGSQAGNAITVYANENDQYPGGTAYRDGKAVPGDLAFKAYSREVFTFARVWGDFLARAGGDLPFCLCYGGLILGACAGLAWALRRRDRLPGPRG
jgi:hypothetical protein